MLPSPRDEPPWLGLVEAFIKQQTGLVFDAVRLRQLDDSVRRLAGDDVVSWCASLLVGAISLDPLIAEITIGETYFFRHPEALDLFERELLPELARGRGPEHRIRAWSAGCATGEEAYTLAILLAEAGMGDRADVLGTDLSAAALKIAGEGVYGLWSVRGESAARTRRHLRMRTTGRLAIEPSFKRRVRFALLNLASDDYPSVASGTVGMDLILCRNVLIYIDPAITTKVGKRLHDALAPGGWLLTAATDPRLADAAPWAEVRVEGGVWYQRAGAEPAPIKFAPRTRASPKPIVARRPVRARAAPAPGPPVIDGPRPASVIRALADRGALQSALESARHAAQIDANDIEVHYLFAVVALELGALDEAVVAARRVRYLDGSLAVGHVVAAAISRRRGRVADARRHYRNARDLLSARPVDEHVRFAGGVCAGRFALQITAQLAQLGEAP